MTNSYGQHSNQRNLEDLLLCGYRMGTYTKQHAVYYIKHVELGNPKGGAKPIQQMLYIHIMHNHCQIVSPLICYLRLHIQRTMLFLLSLYSRFYISKCNININLTL